MRFMQAHGIDTTHVRKDTLHQFCKGGRPLYMRVGREVVRAPTFASPDMHQVSCLVAFDRFDLFNDLFNL